MRKSNFYQIFEKQYGAKSKNLFSFKPVKKPLLHLFIEKFEKHRRKKVSELLPSQKPLRILEIGCGDGLFLKENEDHWYSISGVDVVPSLIKRAKEKKYSVPAEFECADYGEEKIPMKKGTVDLVICIATLQYVQNLEHIFSEVHRVLVTNGNFIFEVPNATVFWRRLQFLFGRLPQTSSFRDGWLGGVIHYFTEHDLRMFLEINGFTVKKVACAGIFDRLRSIWPSVLGADLIFVCQKVEK